MKLKPRLPLAPARPSARASAPHVEPAERVACNRALVCVQGDAAHDALRFACGVLERVRAGGHAGSLLSAPAALQAAAGQRLRALGVRLHAVDERELPGAALHALAQAPHGGVVVAIGGAFAAHFEALLTVHIGARAGLGRGAACDLETTRDDGLIATLIGDWLCAHIGDVSAEAGATLAKNPGV